MTPLVMRLAGYGGTGAPAGDRGLPGSAMLSVPGLQIHRLDLGVSNAYLLETERGLVLVDAGLPLSAEPILARMAQIGRADLRLIFITHAHVDHYGSAAALRRATGAPIAVHRADADDMAAGRTRLGVVRDWAWTQATLPLVEPLLRVEPAQADLVLDEGELPAGLGITAQVIHTPGHTPGSCTLLVEGGYAFVGDLISTNGRAHIQQAYAQNWGQIAASLEKLRRLQPRYLFPGHGPTPVTGDMLAEMKIDGPAANARAPSSAPTPDGV